MVVGASICCVCTAGGGVSFSGIGRRRAGVDLLGGDLVAAAGFHLSSAFTPLSFESCWLSLVES